MSQQEVSCGLEYIVAPDLQGSLTEAFHANYSFIVTPVVHPRFRRHHIADGTRVGGFTRSDMILSPQDWTSRIVGRLSPYLNVDSPNEVVRQRHEDCMNEELSYSKGLGLPALLVTVHGENSHNLARNLLSYLENSHHPTLIWAQVPMQCSRTLRDTVVRGLDDDEEAWNEPWLWWSKFHERLQWDKRAGVVLELSADLPPEEIVKRWLGEPVKAVILPTNIFHNNKKGYPVLSRAHQQVLISLVEREAQVVVCGARRASAEHYRQYVARLWARRPAPNQDPMMDYARGWEDYLQTPLQPLADNLDTHTYNVFEKDPIKYDQYQKAITQALQHLLKKREKSSCEQNETKDLSDVINRLQLGSGDNKQCAEEKDGPFVVMVLGAGRGPLVRAALNASDIVQTKIKVIAVEKNPCAVVVLEAQARELWGSRDVTVVPGDMRRLQLANKADIIVSELLGSWGDNELSPECLDGAAGLLKPDGISIPHRYTSYVAPVSSPRLWAAAKAATALAPHKNNLEMLWVVYMQNKHDIAETKPVFTFEHPAKPVRDHEGQGVTDFQGLPATDNRRQCTLTWTAQQDNVMHGFGGYFDCQLFGDEEISIVPATHSNGMISWFPVFIPIKSPLRVSKGSVITARFWRCVDSHRVWYEWLVELDGRSTELHNCGGKSAEMLL
ncbi:protein arginine N-methyltransferase 5 [Cydia splendana]|uniref:protein arginine N-methyltransferase 5 n=1 Tax=Cydia splendana TaxID=1100963 RepID=UPI00300C9E99